MAYTEQIGEIFDKINNAKTKQEKKDLLIQYRDSAPLRFILRGTFDPTVQFTINEEPDYTPSGEDHYGDASNNLYFEVPKCSIFVKGHKEAAALNKEKAKQHLTEILESLHPQEASIYMGMLKKKLKIKGLTSNLVLEVFPNMYKGA